MRTVDIPNFEWSASLLFGPMITMILIDTPRCNPCCENVTMTRGIGGYHYRLFARGMARPEFRRNPSAKALNDIDEGVAADGRSVWNSSWTRSGMSYPAHAGMATPCFARA